MQLGAHRQRSGAGDEVLGFGVEHDAGGDVGELHAVAARRQVDREGAVAEDAADGLVVAHPEAVDAVDDGRGQHRDALGRQLAGAFDAAADDVARELRQLDLHAAVLDRQPVEVQHGAGADAGARRHEQLEARGAAGDRTEREAAFVGAQRARGGHLDAVPEAAAGGAGARAVDAQDRCGAGWRRTGQFDDQLAQHRHGQVERDLLARLGLDLERLARRVRVGIGLHVVGAGAQTADAVATVLVGARPERADAAAAAAGVAVGQRPHRDADDRVAVLVDDAALHDRLGSELDDQRFGDVEVVGDRRHLEAVAGCSHQQALGAAVAQRDARLALVVLPGALGVEHRHLHVLDAEAARCDLEVRQRLTGLLVDDAHHQRAPAGRRRRDLGQHQFFMAAAQQVALEPAVRLLCLGRQHPVAERRGRHGDRERAVGIGALGRPELRARPFAQHGDRCVGQRCAVGELHPAARQRCRAHRQRQRRAVRSELLLDDVALLAQGQLQAGARHARDLEDAALVADRAGHREVLLVAPGVDRVGDAHLDAGERLTVLVAHPADQRRARRQHELAQVDAVVVDRRHDPGARLQAPVGDQHDRRAADGVGHWQGEAAVVVGGGRRRLQHRAQIDRAVVALDRDSGPGDRFAGFVDRDSGDHAGGLRLLRRRRRQQRGVQQTGGRERALELGSDHDPTITGDQRRGSPPRKSDRLPSPPRGPL